MYFFERTGIKRVTFVTLFFLFLCIFSVSSNKAHSAVYQTTSEFLSENFSEPPSKAESLWLTPELKKLSTQFKIDKNIVLMKVAKTKINNYRKNNLIKIN